jgi:hypothetical protein
MLAGELQFGSESMEMTEIRICSTPNTGLHRSSAFSSSLKGSFPGLWRIEIQTLPSGYTR